MSKTLTYRCINDGTGTYPKSYLTIKENGVVTLSEEGGGVETFTPLTSWTDEFPSADVAVDRTAGTITLDYGTSRETYAIPSGTATPTILIGVLCWQVTDLELTTPQLNTPSHLSAEVVGQRRLSVSLLGVPNANGICIQYSCDATFLPSVEIVLPNGVYESDVTDLIPGVTYYFRAKALGDGALYSDSNWSNSVSATTQSANKTVTYRCINDGTGTYPKSYLTIKENGVVTLSEEGGGVETVTLPSSWTDEFPSTDVIVDRTAGTVTLDYGTSQEVYAILPSFDAPRITFGVLIWTATDMPHLIEETPLLSVPILSVFANQISLPIAASDATSPVRLSEFDEHTQNAAVHLPVGGAVGQVLLLTENGPAWKYPVLVESNGATTLMFVDTL